MATMIANCSSEIRTAGLERRSVHTPLLVGGAGKLEVGTEFQPGVAAGAPEAQDDRPVAEEDELPFACVEPHGLIEVITCGPVVSCPRPLQFGELFEHAWTVLQ